MAQFKAGIVGAGIAGACCAGILREAGWEVEIFEKSQGAGGRLATKRFDAGWATLGSPFVSSKRDPFRSQLREWTRQGWVKPVRGDVWSGRANLTWAQAQLQNHYSFEIEPSQIVRNLMRDATLHTGAKVTALAPRTITLEDGTVRDDFDCVICAIPSPQAMSLLEGLPRLRERLMETRYRPVWSFLMRWEGGPNVDVIKFDDHLLNMAVRMPHGGPGLWAVHASHEFSETYIDAHPMEAHTRAASALMGLLGLPWPVEVEAEHLWRYALPTSETTGFWFGDREHRVALIGDGVAGSGVERAWESGFRFAKMLSGDHDALEQQDCTSA
jgi:predicted NAD/FAD-dependent oxidoreductase